MKAKLERPTSTLDHLAAWTSLYMHLSLDGDGDGPDDGCGRSDPSRSPWTWEETLRGIDHGGIVAKLAATRELLKATASPPRQLEAQAQAEQAQAEQAQVGRVQAEKTGADRVRSPGAIRGVRPLRALNTELIADRIGAHARELGMPADTLHDVMLARPDPCQPVCAKLQTEQFAPISRDALTILGFDWTSGDALNAGGGGPTGALAARSLGGPVACAEVNEPGDVGADVSFTLLTWRSYDVVKQIADPDRWDDCSPFFVDTHWTGAPPPNGGSGSLYEEVVLGLPWFGGTVWGKKFVTDLTVSVDEVTPGQLFRCGFKLNPAGTYGDGQITRDHGCYRVESLPFGTSVSLRKQLRFSNPAYTLLAKVGLKAGFMLEAIRAINGCTL